MGINDVLKTELKKIRPSSSTVSSLMEVATNFISSLKKVGVNSELGGSLAKGTLVKTSGKPDIDLFVVFKTEEEIKGLGGVLEKIKLPGELKTVHGSRDYFQIENDKHILEVIPVVRNTDPDNALNVTDFSLSHVGYVVDAIEKNQGIADDIRLAKSFARAQKCYGAESYIHGFSGYSLEVLVIYYGGFEKFLRGIGKETVMDPEKHFKGEREVMREINSSKLASPIVLVDPTHKYRNISAGLGEETFLKFLGAAKAFLKNPSEEFFEMKEIDLDFLKELALKKGAKFVTVKLRTDRQEGDIAGTKMRKFLDFFARELKRKGQEVIKIEFEYSGAGQEGVGYVVVKEVKEVEIRGPATGMKEAVLNFKKAKKDFYENDGAYWFKESVSVEGVFESLKKVEGEMGAGGLIVIG